MLRKQILDEMKRQGLSHYAVVERLSERIPRRTVYQYLSGKSDMGGEKVSILMAELGLSLKRSRK